MSWENICRPKQEGGLGIRRLEEFQAVFELKRVWTFFSESGSIWVAWLKSNVFVGQSFWTAAEDSSRFSPTVKRMLKVRPLVTDLMRCNIGDGKSVSFWYDWWTDFGPLVSMFGERGPRELQIPLDSTVCNATQNGFWSLPPARSEEAETLQLVLTTMEAPLESRGGDRFLWRNGPCSYLPKFSSKGTWNFIRQVSPTVPWSKLIWFKEEIPRCTFVTWLAIQARLPTRDRLVSWGMNVPAACPLCLDGLETHDHLFFTCDFSKQVWDCFTGWMLPTTPASFDSLLSLIDHQRFVTYRGGRSVLKLLLQVIVYSIWRERNNRIFRQATSPVAAVYAGVDRLMRDRLLSVPPRAEDSFSLLQLFFSIMYSYPP